MTKKLKKRITHLTKNLLIALSLGIALAVEEHLHEKEQQLNNSPNLTG